jgi:hypothetical protein
MKQEFDKRRKVFGELGNELKLQKVQKKYA